MTPCALPCGAETDTSVVRLKVGGACGISCAHCTGMATTAPAEHDNDKHDPLAILRQFAHDFGIEEADGFIVTDYDRFIEKTGSRRVFHLYRPTDGARRTIELPAEP